MPKWVDPADLDAAQFFMPRIPAGQADALHAAADAYRAAKVPSAKDDRERILGELRLRTISRSESADEARARFRLLIDDLSDIPADVLREACTAHVNSPDGRFFPTAAELRKHANPLMVTIASRAYRLRAMAKAAEDVPVTPCTPDEAAAIRKEFGV